MRGRLSSPLVVLCRIVPLGGLLVMAAGLSGCGGNQPPSEAASTSATSTTSASAPDGDASTAATTQRPGQAAGGGVRTDGQGRKWLGKVPYDVWFDDPLGVVANNAQQVASRPAETAPDVGSGLSPMPQEQPAAGGQAGGGIDWQTLVAMSILDDETKKVRGRLAENLKALGDFNRSRPDIQWDAAVLAAISEIVIEHSEEVNWKEKAKYVRSLAVLIEAGAQEQGRKGFEAAQLPFEQVVTLLSGGMPAELPEADDQAPFAEVADRAGLMRRMERASDWMGKNILTEESFKAQKAEVLHEAAILTALSQVIATEDYVFTDEEDFQTHAREIIAAAKQAQDAARAENFAGFRDAIARAQKKCNDCHNAGYAFGE